MSTNFSLSFGQVVHLVGYLVNRTSLFVCVTTIVFLYFRRKYSYWSSVGLKNPTPLPWLGTAFHTLITPKPILELQQHRKFGKLYGLYDGFLGANPTLVCGHPEAIKQVAIKHFDNFINRRKPNTYKSIRYRALTYLRDDEWRDMRKALAPVFTSNKLKKMYELMKRCTKNLSDSIEFKMANERGEVDLKAAFSSFTVDIISTCCFSMDLKDYRKSDSELLINARKFFNVSRLKMLVAMAMPKQLLSLFNFDINDVSSIEFFERFATEIINKRRQLAKRPHQTSQKNDDFLQTLIDAATEFNQNNENTSEIPNRTTDNNYNENDDDDDDKIDGYKHTESKDKKPDATYTGSQYTQQPLANKPPNLEYTDKQLGDLEILAQSMLFLAVGHETTATLLSVSSLFLALYPDLQRRLYGEVSEAFLKDNGDISYDRLLSLQYLDAFISEALRYFNPTLVFDREAKNDIEIEVDGKKLFIPKGMGVVIPFHAVHHDEDNFEEPENFDPDRFMPENKHNIKPCTFIPFGVGPRHCLASRFALVEAKLALASLVNKFEFVRSQSTTWPPNYRHHYMLLQMQWPKIKFVDRKMSACPTTHSMAQTAA